MHTVVECYICLYSFIYSQVPKYELIVLAFGSPFDYTLKIHSNRIVYAVNDPILWYSRLQKVKKKFYNL